MASDPVLIAYGVNRKSDGRVIWTRIGEAYPHDQGSGLTVRLDALPRNGRIVLLELDDADDQRLDLRSKRLTHPRGSGRFK